MRTLVLGLVGGKTQILEAGEDRVLRPRPRTDDLARDLVLDGVFGEGEPDPAPLSALSWAVLPRPDLDDVVGVIDVRWPVLLPRGPIWRPQIPVRFSGDSHEASVTVDEGLMDGNFDGESFEWLSGSMDGEEVQGAIADFLEQHDEVARVLAAFHVRDTTPEGDDV